MPCGGGLPRTKAYLPEQRSPEADAALRRLNLCEAAGDFEGFSVEAHAARHAAYYAP
ncbi:hypothetical protein [Streptomyces sp. NPDC014676]|uniref:hypothetical protein n=1 Tax=Streptomyces sp. NPDC014676 TaxID=3364879 RepID=UPI0036F5BDE4